MNPVKNFFKLRMSEDANEIKESFQRYTMSEIINKKEKVLLEHILSNPTIFIKCYRILKAEYFESPLNHVVKYVKEHFEKYSTIPPFENIDVETEVELKFRELDEVEEAAVLDQTEDHCRMEAMRIAILDSVDEVEKGNLGVVQEKAREALLVKLDNSIGLDLFENVEERVKNSFEDLDLRWTGIPIFDEMEIALAPGEIGIICAPTGGGKSVTLTNLGHAYSKQGLDVIYITLELSEIRSAMRADAIFTGVPMKEHEFSYQKLGQELRHLKEHEGYGEFVIKKMKIKSTLSDLRAYIDEYVLTKRKTPDVILIDYLTLLSVNGASDINSNKYDIGEYLVHGARQLGEDFDSIIWTAAQVNKESAEKLVPTYADINGGVSVPQGSDVCIYKTANDEQIQNSESNIGYMKARNASKAIPPKILYECPKTLRFSDKPFTVTQQKHTGGLANRKKEITREPPKKEEPSKTEPTSKVNKVLDKLNKRK